MASTITLKRRIKSIKNTRQITKAMELVSASKLRKAAAYSSKSSEYYNLSIELLATLSQITELERLDLFNKRDVKTKLYVLITSNSGLAGSYNSNAIKILTKNVIEDQKNHVKAKVLCIGNKGAQFVQRISSTELYAAYPAFANEPSANDIRPILNTIIDGFKSKEFDEVSIIFTQFISTINQVPLEKKVLPINKLEINKDESKLPVFTFEPGIDSVIDEISIRLIEAQLFQAVVDSITSEHAMRMVAMKSATDNAKDLIDDYTLELNTARQAVITQELAEISGGVEALKG